MTSAKEALECGQAVMKATKPAKVAEMLYEWNTLLCYLEVQARKEG